MVAKSGPSQFAHRRTDRVLKKIARAQRAIEREIGANGEEYLGNGGDVSQAELCRRAGVAQVTLHNKTHKTTTLPKVNAWLEKIAIRLGKSVATAPVLESAIKSDQSEECKRIATLYNISVLEVEHLRESLAAKQQELDEANKRVGERDAEIAQLRIDLANGKVVRMPASRGPKNGKA